MEPIARAPARSRAAVSLVVASLCASSSALVAPASASAQVVAHAPTVDTLPNGLRVVVLPVDAPGIAAWDVLVRTGSRDEVEPGHSGFAHLFEHMMFRGTERMSAAEYEHRMQALGADNNAYTTEDFTLYTVTLPARSLPELIPIEADRFQHLSYSEPVFQTETRAVLGEYNKNSANPVIAMWEVLSEAAFTRHTYGHTTLGYLRDIEAMPGYYQYSRDFFRRFYTPDNCTVIVAGDVDRASVVRLVTEHFGAWQGRRAQPEIQPEPEQTAPRRRDLAWSGASPPRILVGYRVAPFGFASADSVALEVAHALVFSESSALYQQWVVREQRLLSLESWKGELHRDGGLFVVDARLAQNTNPDDVERAVQQSLDEVAQGRIDPARFRSVVSNLRYAMPMSAQTPSAAAEMVARYMAVSGEVDGYDRMYRALSTVTPEDVARVARTMLTVNRRTTITLAPEASARPGATRVGPGVRRAEPTVTPAVAPTVTPTTTPSRARPGRARPATPTPAAANNSTGRTGR
jgi:zinc protease